MLILVLSFVLSAAATINGSGFDRCNLGSPSGSVGDFPDFASVRDGICVFQGPSEIYAQNLVENKNFSVISKGEGESCTQLISRQVVITHVFGKHFKNPDNSSQFIFGINGKNLRDIGKNYSAKISMKLFNPISNIKASAFFRGRVVLNSSPDLQIVFSIEPEQVNEIINT